MKKVWLLVGVLLVVGGIVIFLATNTGGRSFQNILQRAPSPYWEQAEGGGWKAVGTPPACPQPLAFASVTDVSKATSVLYPGQLRSVGYEPTAGFRFDRQPNDVVIVTAPMDGEIVYAARFLVDGETQYVFDILSPCGIMHRFDHLLVIPPKLQAIADKLPESKEGDSRSTQVSPPVKITQGEILATAVGLRKNNNAFISWTVFDFRQKNRISQNASWAETHPVLYHYAICPFPYLPNEEQEIINALPAADSMSGSQSDFCE